MFNEKKIINVYRVEFFNERENSKMIGRGGLLQAFFMGDGGYGVIDVSAENCTEAEEKAIYAAKERLMENIAEEKKYKKKRSKESILDEHGNLNHSALNEEVEAADKPVEEPMIRKIECISRNVIN
jgi:hypothetical protein